KRTQRGRGVKAGLGVVEHDAGGTLVLRHDEHDAALAGREAMLTQRCDVDRERSKHTRLTAAPTNDGSKLSHTLARFATTTSELPEDGALGGRKLLAHRRKQ